MNLYNCLNILRYNADSADVRNEAMMEDKYINGTVVENRHWTERLYSLRVDAPTRPFQAGQFGKLALTVNGEKIARPYSYVNAPDDPIKEFYSIVVPGGSLSSQLAALQPGDSVMVAKTAAGFLVLDEIPDGRHLWLISTGTGIGPFLSILRTAPPWQRFERVILVHAVRTVAEVAYRDILQQIALQHPEQFTLAHFVSRETTDFALPGRIPAAIENASLEEKLECRLSTEESQVMLCGNPNMVKDTIAVLKKRGLERNRRRTPGHITVEAYW